MLIFVYFENTNINIYKQRGNLILMDEKDKVLLKLYYKARKEAIAELLKEFKNDKKMTAKLKKLRDNDSIKV